MDRSNAVAPTPLRTLVAVASWAAVLGWMWLIFYVSRNPPSQDTVGDLPLIRLLPQWSLQWVYHGGAFAGLSILTYVALRVSVTWEPLAVAFVSFVVALLYGISDEWHQSFIGGRDADIHDVGRDALGAFAVILLAHLASIAITRLRDRQWLGFGRIAGATIAALEGLAVIWVVALWIAAGPESSFSISSLRPREFETALLRQPLAFAAGIPFFAVAAWIGLGRARTLSAQLALLIAPTLSALVVLAVPFAAFVIDVVPDREPVWVLTWAAAASAWAFNGWLLTSMSSVMRD